MTEKLCKSKLRVQVNTMNNSEYIHKVKEFSTCFHYSHVVKVHELKSKDVKSLPIRLAFLQHFMKMHLKGQKGYVGKLMY